MENLFLRKEYTDYFGHVKDPLKGALDFLHEIKVATLDGPISPENIHKINVFMTEHKYSKDVLGESAYNTLQSQLSACKEENKLLQESEDELSNKLLKEQKDHVKTHTFFEEKLTASEARVTELQKFVEMIYAQSGMSADVLLEAHKLLGTKQ